jgi:LysM repeat protein
MKNIAPGLSLKKYKGNKHEQGGIMVNALGNKTKDINKAVAEVEGGEYNYRYNPTNPKDNYILSEQLGIANMAKQADRFKNNDRISYNTRNNLLNKSVKLNEVLKAQQEQSQMQMALGGELKNVNPFDKQPPKQKDSDFRRGYQSTPMNVAKIFDPTGISSYPDVAYSIDDYNKGKGSIKDIALNVLGALPVIGKVKALGTLAKGTSQTKKALNTVTKVGDLAGDIERFPTKVIKESTDRARKPIAKLINTSATSVLNFGDMLKNKITPPLSNKLSTKVVTKSDILNAGTSLLNIGNLGSDINSVSKKQFGGMLKKYGDGGFSDNGPIDDNIQNYYKNITTRDVVSTPGNELTNVPIQPTAPLVRPKLDVSKEMQQAQVAGDNPVKQKKNNFKGALSAVAGAVSALGPIGQGVGTAMQLAPYAIDLGKAMFDKTSVQDLQTQGSAMRLPNTTYAKNGGKLNVKPLPKFDNGGKPKNRTPKSFKNIGEFSDSLSEEQMKLIKDNPEQFNKDMMNWSKKSTTPIIAPTTVPVTTPIVTPTTSNVTNTKPLKIKTKLEIDKKALAGDKSYLDNKSTTQNYIDYYQEKADEISRTNAGVTNKMYRSLSKFFNTPADFDPYFKSNPLNVKPNSLNFTSANPSVQQSLTQTNPLEIKLGKPIQSTYGFDDAPLTDRTKLITNPLDLNLNKLTEQDYINNPKLTKPLNLTKLPTTTPKTVSEAVNLGLKLNTQTNSTPEPIIETPKPSKEVKSLSEQLYNRGQNKQKLSEALMYGMAALPSEQIKTITPDYGRGDDAMSRMGLSTEPIRQEMMQGANKALELSRSQVGTAGQLQSRGQSIMSNLSSQLSQSQIQQQQYLNQLRGALAQREDTKSNVLAQSELTAREAKSAERAAKLDQLNNAISQTSAIGAGTMEQASKMSTIENENERFDRSQKQLLKMANMAGGFKVVIENGEPVLKYDGSSSGESNMKTPSLANPNPLVVTPNPNTTTTPVVSTPKEHVVKKGEGLNAIAAQYKIPVDKLLKLNNLKIGDTIHPNQKLKIE